MPTIQNIHARQILDSRGFPTLEATITLDTGHYLSTSVPSGTSTGKYEAVELRDGDENNFFGMSVEKAVNNVNQTIAPAVNGKDPVNQEEIDNIMIQLDGTANKSKLGANAILAVSQAVAKAGALASGQYLFDYFRQKYQMPAEKFVTPIVNVINGGKHGAGNLDFQEFHIIPTTVKNFSDALQLSVEIYHQLELSLIQMNAIHSVGIEGGYAPNLFTNKDALEIIIESIKRTQHIFGKDVFLGLDVAASNFFNDGHYQIKDRPNSLNPEELRAFYRELNDSINLFSIEDPFVEDDWKSWSQLVGEIGVNSLVVSDDLVAGNKERLQKAIQDKAATAILLKPNQIGTITEAVDIIRTARAANWTVIISHRSGETNDDFIADFAVGLGADYTKFGAPSRGERVAKYNRLCEIYTLLHPPETESA